MTFQSNPLNRDLIGLKNETSIARSIKNIVLTSQREKFFNPKFGTKISQSLFENLDSISSSEIQQQIYYSLGSYEPRIQLIDVTVVPNYDENEFLVTVQYKIVGIDVPPQQLSFAIQPTR